MKKLNLHGLRHHEVDRIVENFIIDTYNKNELPAEIISGNSIKMKEIVKNVIQRHEFRFNQHIWMDSPSIIVFSAGGLTAKRLTID